MFTFIFWLCDEYQSFHEFPDLGAYKFSASLDFCSQSYRKNTIAQSAEEPPKQRSKDVVEVVEHVAVIVGCVTQAVRNVVVVSQK
jgi:hypothetical protein